MIVFNPLNGKSVVLSESPKVVKTITLNESNPKPLVPMLIRFDEGGYAYAPHNIHIDKSEFKIGRARDNDEIILDTMISRRHCILRCEGNNEWTIKDLSSSITFVNDVPLVSGMSQKLNDGDVIQFSTSKQFRYKFTITEQPRMKRPRLDEQILDNVLTEQKTFAESQECQKRVLKEKLQTKQKEQDTLKQQLEQLLLQQSAAKENTDELKKQIVILEDKIASGNDQEQHLHKMYADLLEELENERVQFEKRLNEEKQKWQEALNVSKQEKEALKIKTREQMKKWREEQQAEWKSVMENRVKEERNIQAQLLNEKTVLEEKLKETEKALREKEAIAKTTHNNAAGPSEVMDDSCIVLEIINDSSGLQILDTIDLTISTPDILNTQHEKETVINKVSDIMDEQLTCSICSELFVRATTLNCMHTFCQHCIAMWNRKKKECPVCRAPVASMNRSIVLDNFIESMLENLPTHYKERRKELVNERNVSATKYKRKIR